MSELSTSFKLDMSKKMPIAIEQIKETIVEYEKKIVESEKIISESKKKLKELTEALVELPRDDILYYSQEALRDEIENEEALIANYKYNIGARTVTLGHLMITLGNDMIDKCGM